LTQSHTDESRESKWKKNESGENMTKCSMQDGRGGLNHDYDASERDNVAKSVWKYAFSMSGV
jgi:hypothetical protein